MLNMPHSLTNPNQFRCYSTKVQDNPCDTHSVAIEAQYDGMDFVACLKSRETNIFFDT